MKVKLIEALLSSCHGEAVRAALHLQGQQVYCEVLYFTIRPVPNRELACALQVRVAKWGEEDEPALGADAVDLEIEFTGVAGISYAYDDQHPFWNDVRSPWNLDIEDRFQICCQGFEVKEMRPFNLADGSQEFSS